MKISIYLFSFFLVTLILFNGLRVSMTYAYFELDPVGFIEKLCENRDKPELQCNGKCQLIKVSESQNKEQSIPEGIVGFKEILFFTEILEEPSVLNFVNNKNNFFVYTIFYKYLEIFLLDYPPEV